VNYLRVKDWPTFQHYSKRRPLWIKLYARLLLDDRFNELDETKQAQLIKLWLVVSQSSRFTLDSDDKVVPVIPNDERALRQAIRSSRKVPIGEFVQDGWLVEVLESELIDEEIGRSIEHSLAVVKELRGKNVDVYVWEGGSEVVVNDG